MSTIQKLVRTGRPSTPTPGFAALVTSGIRDRKQAGSLNAAKKES